MKTLKTILLLGAAFAVLSPAHAQFSIGDEVAFSASTNAIFNSDFPGGTTITNDSLQGTSIGSIDFQEIDNANVNGFIGGFADYFDLGNFFLQIPGSTAEFNDLDYKNFTAPVTVWESVDSVGPGAGDTISFTLNDLTFSETDSAGSITVVQIEGTGFITVADVNSIVLDTVPATFSLSGSGTIAGNSFTSATWSANTVVVPEPSTYAAIFGCVAFGLVYFVRKQNKL